MISRIGIIGPESSGGRYMQRLVSSSPSSTKVYHWSMPYGPSRGDRFWPTERCPELILSMDKILVTVRDWHPMVLSAQKEHTNDLSKAVSNAQFALCSIFDLLSDYENWRVVSYESLSQPGSISSLFEWLELLTPFHPEKFVDGNSKWYKESWSGS